MKTTTSALILAAISLSLFPFAGAFAQEQASLSTTTDYTAAVKKAKNEDKTLFVALVMKGCGYCERMKKNVFQDPEFIQFANQKLVTVMYDYQQGGEIRDQMKSIMEKHGLKSFPSVLLFDANGEVLLKSSGYNGSPAGKVIDLFKKRMVQN
jgi:thioredoxin-related protein